MRRQGIHGGAYYRELIYDLYCSRRTSQFLQAVKNGVKRDLLDKEFEYEARGHEIAVTPYHEWSHAFESMSVYDLRTTLRAMNQLGLNEAGELVGHPRLYKDRKTRWSHEEALSVAAAFHASYTAVAGNVHIPDTPWFYLTNTVNLGDVSRSMTYGTYHLEGSIYSGVTVKRVRGWGEVSLIVQSTPPRFASSWQSKLLNIHKESRITEVPTKHQIWAISYPKVSRTPPWIFQLFTPRAYADPVYMLPKLLSRNVLTVGCPVGE